MIPHERTLRRRARRARQARWRRVLIYTSSSVIKPPPVVARAKRTRRSLAKYWRQKCPTDREIAQSSARTSVAEASVTSPIPLLTRAHHVAAHYTRHFPPCPHGAPPEPGPLRCARATAFVSPPPRPPPHATKPGARRLPASGGGAEARARARDPARPRSLRRSRGRRSPGTRLDAHREAGAAPRRARSSATARGERVASRASADGFVLARSWRETRLVRGSVFDSTLLFSRDGPPAASDRL